MLKISLDYNASERSRSYKHQERRRDRSSSPYIGDKSWSEIIRSRRRINSEPLQENEKNPSDKEDVEKSKSYETSTLSTPPPLSETLETLESTTFKLTNLGEISNEKYEWREEHFPAHDLVLSPGVENETENTDSIDEDSESDDSFSSGEMGDSGKSEEAALTLESRMPFDAAICEDNCDSKIPFPADIRPKIWASVSITISMSIIFYLVQYVFSHVKIYASLSLGSVRTSRAFIIPKE